MLTGGVGILLELSYDDGLNDPGDKISKYSTMREKRFTVVIIVKSQ